MNDIGKELYERVRADFERRLKSDKRPPKDMRGVSDYSARVGRYLAEAIAANVTEDALPDRRLYYNIAESILEPSLRANYELVNDTAAEVQRLLDERQGLRIKPARADYPAERVHAVIGAASEEGIEFDRALRRMTSPAENITQSFADDFMQANAEQRSKAGFDTFIERQGGFNCCPWCAGLVGVFAYPKGLPKEVFARHDNCTCSVTYGTKGGARQHVWTKAKWEVTPVQEPHRMTAEEAAAKGGFDKPKRLTGGANGGIINDEQRSKVVTIWDKIKSFFGATPLPPDITDEEISQALSDIGFARVDNSFFTRVNRDLRLSVVDQLKILEDRFHAIENSISPTIAADRTGGAVASVSCPIDTPAKQKLHLSSTKYRNQKSHVAARKKEVKDFFCMPCKTDKETLSRYVVTHEYGHMVENVLSQQDMNGTIRTHSQNCARYKREILDIAKGLDDSFNEDTYLSEYGHKDDHEFFAECFANSQLGEANVLGKAMTIWFERRGF